MEMVINIDGVVSAPQDATISVLDRGFLYGDSVYEVVRTYDGVIFAFEQHMARMDQSAAGLGIELPDRDWICQQVDRTIDAVKSGDCYCRIIVTRGSGPLTLDPTTAKGVRTVIIAKAYEPFPEWTYSRGISVTIPSIRRTAPDSLDPAIKSGNYLNSVLALGEAKKGGFFDALMLDHKGLVTEATSSNVFVARDGKLYTPALEYGLLAGVTRSLLLEVARENGFECSECQLTVEDLLSADEVMLTSTLREVQPVTRVDDNAISDGTPGPTAARLRILFHEYAMATIGPRGGQRGNTPR